MFSCSTQCGEHCGCVSPVACKQGAGDEGPGRRRGAKAPAGLVAAVRGRRPGVCGCGPRSREEAGRALVGRISVVQYYIFEGISIRRWEPLTPSPRLPCSWSWSSGTWILATFVCGQGGPWLASTLSGRLSHPAPYEATLVRGQLRPYLFCHWLLLATMCVDACPGPPLCATMAVHGHRAGGSTSRRKGRSVRVAAVRVPHRCGRNGPLAASAVLVAVIGGRRPGQIFLTGSRKNLIARYLVALEQVQSEVEIKPADYNSDGSDEDENERPYLGFQHPTTKAGVGSSSPLK